MKTRHIILLFISVAACAFVANHRRPPVDDAPRLPDRHEQMRREVLEACTNQVVGLNRIIDLNYTDASTNVSDWRAAAAVEYVNALGGVERTNLAFRFEGFGSGVICLPDRGK